MGIKTVFFFEKYDIVKGETVRSKRPATLEAITRAKGAALKDTAQEVDESSLDGNGFLMIKRD